MKVLIQNCKTSKYLTEDLRWNSALEHTKVLNSTVHAIHVCMSHRFTDVQVVLKFNRSDLDVYLPLQSRSGLGSSSLHS